MESRSARRRPHLGRPDGRGAGIAEVAVAGRPPHPGLDRRWRELQGAGDWRLDPIAGTTAEDGSFELSRIPPLAPLELTVTKSGFASRYATAPVLAPGLPVDELLITLERGIAGTGRVITEDERPIAGGGVGRQAIEVAFDTEIVIEIGPGL